MDGVGSDAENTSRAFAKSSRQSYLHKQEISKFTLWTNNDPAYFLSNSAFSTVKIWLILHHE